MDGGLGFSFGTSSSSHAAERSAKRIQKAIKQASEVTAKGTAVAAELGLEAQRIRARSEEAKTTRAALIKWTAITGGVLLGVLGVIYFITRRKGGVARNRVRVTER